jgi:hypothetical protein
VKNGSTENGFLNQTSPIGKWRLELQGCTFLLSYSMCLYTQEYWRKSFSKIAKNDKIRNFVILKVAPKIHQNLFP